MVAGLIAGGILLVVPRGSPWAYFTSFSAVIMGRAVPASAGLPLLVAWAIHLALALAYSLVIAGIVARQPNLRAMIAGGLTGLVLYLVNWGATTLLWPGYQGSETPVMFAHLVFGLLAAGAYRGLLRRKRVTASAP